MKLCAVILAPHPDDECIIGLLPLRLQEECRFEIEVVPLTLGSRPERRAARRRELQAACASLGFKPHFPGSLAGAMAAPAEVARVLTRLRPAVVLLPHARDGHPTHRAAHRAGVAALDAVRGMDWTVVETEYWHPLEHPNLMVGARRTHVRRLARALACHAGEVARNDYAARLPAWMSDNVRRGAERVGGCGAAAPALDFATLYRARRRAGGRWRAAFRGGRILAAPGDLRQWVAEWGHGRTAPDA